VSNALPSIGPIALDDSIHNWDISPFDIVHHRIANINSLFVGREDEVITTMEDRFHAASKDGNNRGCRVSADSHSFLERKR
jgi:hypothetical protein